MVTSTLRTATRPAPKTSSRAQTASPSGDKLTKGTRTKALIKRVVAELIDEKGIDGVTLEDVCARTQLTIGAFYFHFGNKDAALEEVAIDSLKAYYDNLIESPSTICLYNEIHGIIEASVELHLKHPAMARLMYTMVPRSNSVYGSWVAIRDRLIERLALASARERQIMSSSGGAASPDGQDYLCAQFLLAGSEGFFENAFYGSDPQFSKIDLKPASLVRDISVLWYRSVTGTSPAPALVEDCHRQLLQRMPGKRVRAQRTQAK